MHGAYGADTGAKLQECWAKAEAAGARVIQQAIIDQAQAFLDAKNKSLTTSVQADKMVVSPEGGVRPPSLCLPQEKG